MADLLGVELARPGVWPLRSGQLEFTPQMLRDAADFYAETGGQAVPIALGHSDERFTGEPAFGQVTNIRYEEDDRGPVLKGDLSHMPDWLAASAPRSWPNRSIEGFQGFEHDGRRYELVLTALAFLGATPPAVRNIQSLSDLQLALAASAARFVAASAPQDDASLGPVEAASDAKKPYGDVTYADPGYQPDGKKRYPLDSAEHCRAAWSYINQPANAAKYSADQLARIKARIKAAAQRFGVQISAASAEDPKKEGAGMDPAKIREALGLPADASDDEVKAQLVAAGLAQQPNPPDPRPQPEPTPDKAPELVNASATELLDQQQMQKLVAAAKAGGVVTIDAATVAQFQEGMVRAAALAKRIDQQDRDATITEAVKAGKFPPARRAHYERLWEVDPDGTKQVIASLAANLVPVTASGYAGDGEDAIWEAEFGRLFPPSGGR